MPELPEKRREDSAYRPASMPLRRTILQGRLRPGVGGPGTLKALSPTSFAGRVFSWPTRRPCRLQKARGPRIRRGAYDAVTEPKEGQLLVSGDAGGGTVAAVGLPACPRLRLQATFAMARALISRPWTPEEDARLVVLIEEGKSFARIAARLRRTTKAIISRSNRLTGNAPNMRQANKIGSWLRSKD